ncbi:MAG: hypothetical protein Q4G04_03535 [bacterium]|nr:hypothetical protein [bacterium]
MENTDTNSYKTFKILFIILSIIVATFTLTGYIATSDRGGTLSLFSFESFYVYIITIAVSLYMVITNKNANFMIILSLLTYVWTYYLMQQLIEYLSEVNIIIEPFFYIYLSSAVFLIISLFFNDKKQDNKKPLTNFQNENTEMTNSLNKNNFMFASFVLGLKEIPLNTEVLLVNNVLDNSLDLIYFVDNNNRTIKFPTNIIKQISYKSDIRMQNISKKFESNEMKSMLLSAVTFGGTPLLQFAGAHVFNSFFDAVSNNYDKVDFNVYYEITIETLIDGQEIEYVLNTDSNPEEFIKQVSNGVIK